MNTNNPKQIIGVFPNQETVERVRPEGQNINLSAHQISMMNKNVNTTRNSVDKANQLPTTRAEGAKAGAILGSVGVGFTTLTIGLGILFVPGVGPALALDSILTACLGSGLASATGGLYGAFLGYLDPEKQAKLYREQLKQQDCFVINRGNRRGNRKSL